MVIGVRGVLYGVEVVIYITVFFNLEIEFFLWVVV